ncbi:hypothetical protein Sinac_7145 [Singulisphaera acidiphila DSM 18658]|uniref:Uncharacterized protein n=1 Tax=Singulisphaera acidiphila (strain ATCC BAA-1392 / DSM 18658 / VKM B-2454 / MOB10) TaxID=886293 RepID=L0DS18_SINAD|nr:hypothetical protein Sinac_7145 [Singulisphaera acidiphila DSM 18658]
MKLLEMQKADGRPPRPPDVLLGILHTIAENALLIFLPILFRSSRVDFTTFRNYLSQRHGATRILYKTEKIINVYQRVRTEGGSCLLRSGGFGLGGSNADTHGRSLGKGKFFNHE